MTEYDGVVIGAGVTGCAVARELSKYQGKFLVLDQNADVCEGTSKANSAILHAGFDAHPGSWKARMNVRGNEMMDALSQELSIPFSRIGALVVCLREEELPALQALYERGVENGVRGLSLLTGEQAKAMEPNLADSVCGALLAETSGVVCPFEMTVAMGECAVNNGVEFRLETTVTGVKPAGAGYVVITNGGEIFTRTVVNAAGLYADVIHNQICEDKLEIVPRLGEYCLLDKAAGGHVAHTIFQLPGKLGKGVLVSPTVHGNLLVGPTAKDTADRDSVVTTAQGLEEVGEKAALSVKNVPLRQVITSFMGLRAHEKGDDFLLGETAPGFFEAAGIESPGLSSAPAIGEYLAGLIGEKLSLEKNQEFQPLRQGVVHMASLSMEERKQKIKENPGYGAIICRCEEVSEGEILDAIHRPLGAKTLDGVKRRTRAGMGRCQSGFCSPRVMEILAREWNMELSQVRKGQQGSELVLERTRERGGR